MISHRKCRSYFQFRKRFGCVGLSLLLLFISVSARADDKTNLTGTWSGEVAIPGKEITFVFDITHPVKIGKITGTVLWPKENSVIKVPLSQAVLRGREVTFRADSIGGVFTGRLSSNGKRINGDWAQDGYELDLKLERAEDAEAVKTGDRPQHPTGKPNYLVEEVSFKNPNSGVSLAGSLTIPSNAFGKRPAVLLLSDIGPHDRDSAIGGHKFFWVLTDYLTRQGFAVLRFDDRGTGKSAGDHKFLSHQEMAADAEAAFSLLRGRSKIDATKLGVIGHGEGAIIASLLAGKREDLRFLVMMGAPGKKGTETMFSRTHAIGLASKVSPKIVQLGQDFSKALLELATSANPDQGPITRIYRQIEEEIKTLSEKEMIELADLGKHLEFQMDHIEAPWMIQFLRHDPGPALEKISCPVLAITGERDLEFLSKLHLPEIEKRFKKGGNTQAQVRELRGLNHLFQECKSGLPTEYAIIEQTISPRVLKGIADWLSNATR